MNSWETVLGTSIIGLINGGMLRASRLGACADFVRHCGIDLALLGLLGIVPGR